MNQFRLVIPCIMCIGILSGCVGNPANNEVSYNAYEPGYTGYTIGAGAYGIPNGYGPAYWSPGYYNYTGYETSTSNQQGYIYQYNGTGCRTVR